MLFSDCGPPQENPRKDVCLHDCHDQTRGERVEQGELKGSVMDIRYPARYLDIVDTGDRPFYIRCLSGRIFVQMSGIRSDIMTCIRYPSGYEIQSISGGRISVIYVIR